MLTLRVLPGFDKAKAGHTRLTSNGKTFSIDEFAFERSEKALAERVIVAGFSHGGPNAGPAATPRKMAHTSRRRRYGDEIELFSFQSERLPAAFSHHWLRTTGITEFLEQDGALEEAQQIAGHSDARTTKLYDRRGRKIKQDEIQRLRFERNNQRSRRN